VLHTLASISVMCFLMWKCPITHTGDGLAGGRKWPLAFSPARGLSTSKSDSHLHDKGNELPEKQWHWHRLNQHQLGEELVLYVPVTDASFITVATAARSTPEASGCRPQTVSRPVLLTCGGFSDLISPRTVSSVPREAARNDLNSAPTDWPGNLMKGTVLRRLQAAHSHSGA
jgi:hypothetical protein